MYDWRTILECGLKWWTHIERVCVLLMWSLLLKDLYIGNFEDFFFCWFWCEVLCDESLDMCRTISDLCVIQPSFFIFCSLIAEWPMQMWNSNYSKDSFEQKRRERNLTLCVHTLAWLNIQGTSRVCVSSVCVCNTHCV